MRTSLTLVVALALGCAPKVPQELAAARTAYAQAAAGPAAELVPADLHKAEVALAAAEDAFADQPHNYHTLDLAYVAQRKAQLADALAGAAVAQRQQEQARQDYEATQGAMIGQAKEALTATQQQLEAAEQARIAADQATAAALSQLAQVREEDRGLVITLSGSVLFASDQSALLPEARTRLDDVATALLEHPRRSLIVEGHTDSTGSDEYNLSLSQRRADAVASYLVSRGYDSALIQARGIGETRPVADNATAEGRANNRRVEIIVGQEVASLR